MSLSQPSEKDLETEVTDYSDFPLHLSSVVPGKLFHTINREMQGNWALNNASVRNGDGRLSWGKEEKNLLVFIEAASIVKLKIQKTLKRDITLCRIHCNAQTLGQESLFHSDFRDEFYWTFILFTEDLWDTNWGGEFVCFNPVKKKYEYTPYIPNTGVLIPSNWEHDGRSPTQTHRMRTSLAFSYVDSRYANDHFSKYPQYTGLR